MNLKEKLLGVTEYFSPKIIGEVNDVFIKLVKIKGDKEPWHNLNNGNNYEYSVTSLDFNASNKKII